MRTYLSLATAAATLLNSYAAITLTKDLADFDNQFTGAQIYDGTSYQNGWTGGADDANFDLTTTSNQLNIATTGNNSGDILTGTATGAGATSWSSINAAGSWTAELNASFNDVSNGWAMWLGAQGTDLILVEIYHDRIQDFGGTVLANADLDNGSDYTIRVAHDATTSSYSAWLNNTLIAEDQAYSTTLNENRFLLGDWSGGSFGNDTNVTINSVSYTAGAFAPIPEPSPTLLIGLAGLGLLVRRRH